MDAEHHSKSNHHRELTEADTRANDHPETVDMAEVVLSINSHNTPPPPPFRLMQSNNYSPKSEERPTEAQITNDGTFNHPTPQRAVNLCLSPSSSQQTSNTMGGVGTNGEVHNPLRRSGDQQIVLVIEDTVWMAQIIKEGIDKIAEGLGHQL
ncbi:hypothetical protein FXO38_31387 [Capsicum annuum]|nr:hypothetical protein FXO38_31387 [Capsicum annuum]